MEAKPPVEIVVKDTGALVGFACGTCGVFFTTRMNGGGAESKEQAAKHCVKMCACGNPVKYHYSLLCDSCQSAKETEKERIRFEKATKVTIEDYDGPVFWGDKFYGEVESLLDDLENDGVEVPEYVWAASPQAFELSASDIVERELERQEMHEEAWDSIESAAMENLQTFLEVWCKEVNLVSYFEDHGRAVLLRPDAVAQAG